MKYALVTGSNRGIGKAIADEFERKGYTVIRNGRSKCEEKNYIQADLSNMDGVYELCQKIMKENIKLDCIVLNAGTTCRKPWRELTVHDWEEVMNVNLIMPFFVVQKLYEQMQEKASVVFVSSLLALEPHATSIPYGVSKAGVNMLAKNLVKELAEKEIRVNVICPGFIDTEWQKKKTQAIRDKICRKIALNRFGEPEEVAKACIALCENSYMNGSVITIDGGYDMK